jgi:hypothetical protein
MCSNRSTAALFVLTIVLLTLNGCGNPGKSTAGNSSPQPVVAWKPPPPESSDVDKQEAADLLRAFLDPCVGKFPNDDAVGQYAAGHELTPMSAGEVSALLGKGPGIGWIQRDESRTYWLTVEKPPYHACAVRTTFGHNPLALQSFLALQLGLMVSVSRTGDRLQEQAPQALELAGLPTTLSTFLRINSADQPIEQYIVLIAERPDGTFPTRIVRQILAQ